VQLSLGALVADPMHQLSAAKGDVLGMNVVLGVALIVPFHQRWELHCFKRRVCTHVSTGINSAALRTTTIVPHTLCNLALPLMAANWTLPLSAETTASKSLLRCLGIFPLIQVSCLSRCLGGQRAVPTQYFPLTKWAFGASCAVIHSRLPNMRVSCWTVGARPFDLQAAVWLDLDAAKQSIVVWVPLLLQLGPELTDVWQAHIQVLALLLLWPRCCGLTAYSWDYNKTVPPIPILNP